MDKVFYKNKPKGLGIRHLQVLLCFLGFTFALVLRVNMSVAIVAMTDESLSDGFDTFKWDEATKGLILSSFFWGYVVTMIPAGILTHIFGAKIIFFCAMTLAAIFTVLTPVIAPLGWGFVCALRVLNGLSQGFIYPSVYNLMAKWVHPTERAFSVIINAGAQFGVFFMYIISGSIASSSMGWPGLFYVSGGLGFFWSALWLVFGSNSPAAYKNIAEDEKQFLEQSIGTATNDRLSIPWKSVWTSWPFLAMIFTHSSHNWGYYILMTEIPKFMNDILNFDLKENAFMSSLPYLVMFLLGLFFSPFSDFLIKRQYLHVGTARKIFNSIGMWIPMVSLIGLAFVNKENPMVAVILLMIAVGFNAGANAGFFLNSMDLAPNFSGTLFSVSNCFANVISIIGPLFVGFVVTEPTDESLWQIVFFVTSGVYFIGNLVFVLFGKGTIQSWNGVKILEPTTESVKSDSNKTLA